MTKTLNIVGCMAIYLAASCAVTSFASAATILYSNGSLDGTTNAVSISAPPDFTDNWVTDSFDLGGDSLITAINFAVWVTPNGDVPTSVNWAITTTAFNSGAGVTVASGTASLTSTFVETDPSSSFDIDTELFSGLNVSLTQGTYWLQLHNVQTSPNDNFVYWDENDGPSTAYTSSDGTFGSACKLGDPCSGDIGVAGSETFEILGTPTPEPGTVTTLLSGFLLLAVPALYKKARR